MKKASLISLFAASAVLSGCADMPRATLHADKKACTITETISIVETNSFGDNNKITLTTILDSKAGMIHEWHHQTNPGCAAGMSLLDGSSGYDLCAPAYHKQGTSYSVASMTAADQKKVAQHVRKMLSASCKAG